MTIKKIKPVIKKAPKKSKRLTQRELLEDKIAFLEKHDPKGKELKELKKTLKLSKRGRTSKSKGSNYERNMAKVFKDKLDVDLVRTPQSGGFAKKSEKASEFRGDIVSLDETIDFKLHIECKNQKNVSMPSWIKQSEEDCPVGKIPVIVFHRNQENKDGKRVQEAGDYVTLTLEDFLDIVDKEKIIEKL